MRRAAQPGALVDASLRPHGYSPRGTDGAGLRRARSDCHDRSSANSVTGLEVMLRMSRAHRVKGIDAVTSYVARRFTAARSPRGLLERTLQPSLGGHEVLIGPDGYQIANAARIALEQEIAKACYGFRCTGAVRSCSEHLATNLDPAWAPRR